jgi:hypothetical protein
MPHVALHDDFTVVMVCRAKQHLLQLCRQVSNKTQTEIMLTAISRIVI